ncbi:MAG: hypothetical protein H6R12_2002, partial [Proteobacteria bacterium]|nr:hypothetical protein [Pseudomonadota bacterium]
MTGGFRFVTPSGSVSTKGKRAPASTGVRQ